MFDRGGALPMIQDGVGGALLNNFGCGGGTSDCLWGVTSDNFKMGGGGGHFQQLCMGGGISNCLWGGHF